MVDQGFDIRNSPVMLQDGSVVSFDEAFPEEDGPLLQDVLADKTRKRRVQGVYGLQERLILIVGQHDGMILRDMWEGASPEEGGHYVLTIWGLTAAQTRLAQYTWDKGWGAFWRAGQFGTRYNRGVPLVMPEILTSAVDDETARWILEK